MAQKTQKARVIHSYDADDANQLSIKEGEIITLVGDVTPEDWILARNAQGKEGYIPDQYFERMGRAGPPPKGGRGPPPRAPSEGDKVGTGGAAKSSLGSKKGPPAMVGGYATVKRDSAMPDIEVGAVLHDKDAYSFFAYQLEWSTIAVLFTASVLSFMYGTTQPDERCWVIGMICVPWVVLLAAALAFARECTCRCLGTANRAKALNFFLVGALLCGAYPVGLYGIFPVLCLLWVYFWSERQDLKDVPDSLANHWTANMFGGVDKCTHAKLITFLILLAIDCALIGWGYVDGYEYARRLNKRKTKKYDLDPVTMGVAGGFGRIITVNMVILLVWLCHGCYQRRAKRVAATNSEGKCHGRCCIFMADKDRRDYMHRFLSYNIVWAAFCHSIAHFYAYELSGATKTYADAFGYETIVTGGFLLGLLAVLMGSGNKDYAERMHSSWKYWHFMAAMLFAMLLFFHGKDGTSKFYWMFGIAPTVLYTFDLFLRWLAGDLWGKA